MNDAVRVQILECVDDLHCVTLHFEFVESLAPFQQLVHTCILAQFEQNIDILAIFEKVLEVTHVCMLDGAVNLDLTHELLFGTTLCQTGLLYDFRCMGELGLGIDEFEALRKATLAEELSFEIHAFTECTILLLKLFFDESLLRTRGGMRGLAARLAW